MRLSTDPRARRRLATLAAGAAAALAAGVAVGAGEGGDERSPGGARSSTGDHATPLRPTDGPIGTRPGSTDAGRAGRPNSAAPKRGRDRARSADRRALPALYVSAETLDRARRLPVDRLAGQAVILRFTGHSVPGYVERALRADLVAGAILFDDNAPTRAAVRAVSRRLQRAAGGDALISTDQEGGAIRRLHWGAPKSAQAALAAPGDAANAARAAARSLRRAGLNVNFAPVADVATAGSVMRGRAYAGGSAAVARRTGAAVRAYRGTGVIPAVKHFPGLGAATVNTDDAAATIDRSAATLAAVDLPPFQAAIAAGAPVVMVSHARYPALDRQRIASQSSAIIGNLLRDRMGFRGVVITDSLEAAAVRDSPDRASVRSMRAGADLILTTGAGSHLRVVRALTAEARRSRKFRARLIVAAARVRALRASLRG